MAYFIRVCAWCGKILGKEKIEGEKDIISHGMCEECYKKWKEDFEKLKKGKEEEDGQGAF